MFYVPGYDELDMCEFVKDLTLTNLGEELVKGYTEKELHVSEEQAKNSYIEFKN